MIKKTLALVALAVVTTTAQAGTPAPIAPTIEPESSISYSNLSLSKQYASGKIDVSGLGLLGLGGEADLDSDGVALALEYSPVNNLYVALGGSYNEIEASLDVLGVASMSAGLGDYWTANLGIGGYIPLTSNIHFVTELGANYVDLLNQDNAWGIYVTPHIRASFGKFETHLGATYNSNDFAITQWNGFLRLIYAATPELDLFATGSLGFSDSDIVQDVAGVSVGLRYKF
jgi:hypothetical protein